MNGVNNSKRYRKEESIQIGKRRKQLGISSFNNSVDLNSLLIENMRNYKEPINEIKTLKNLVNCFHCNDATVCYENCYFCERCICTNCLRSCFSCFHMFCPFCSKDM